MEMPGGYCAGMYLVAIVMFSIFAAWKWGDWRNWREYLPTIQFFIIGDLLYNLFTWDYPLWSYPHPPSIFRNHLITNLFIMFTIYPSAMLIFLYRYPMRRFKQFIYILLWIGIWILFEIYMHFISKLCEYTHGWTFAWSIFFIIIMNLMFILHHKNPKWAYLLSAPFILFLLWWFQVPVLNKT